MRRRGVDVGEAIEERERTPAAPGARWKAASLGPANPLRSFFIQH